ncbi:MAG TPA: hypothetical protein VER96_17885, partial [Polyangiaceae bacterium]|nr:hypothetical protein [Polyangiaceae bacterium]
GMSDRTARRLSAAAWLAPLVWVAAWGLFRGAFAHGGYAWWETAHVYGALALLACSIALQRFVWKRRGVRGTVVASGVSQTALVTAVLVASWLCF